MDYTIKKNAEFDSLEISFDGKPSAEVRDALKGLRFRWHGQKKVWYGYAEESAVRSAIENAGGETVKAETETAAKNDSPKRAAVDKNMLRQQFSKAWDSEKMIDFCVNKVAAVAILPGGEIVTVDKQSIETRFCFGESGYDYDEAAEAAQHARKSSEYFKRENMESFNRWIKDLEEAKDYSGNYALVIGRKAYYKQDEDCKLCYIGFERLNKIIEVCGGSCYLEELPGRELKVDGLDVRIATAEEIDLILEAYKAAAAAHEKKVDNYLKRYGLSKVHAWTYWRDA